MNRREGIVSDEKFEYHNPTDLFDRVMAFEKKKKRTATLRYIECHRAGALCRRRRRVYAPTNLPVASLMKLHN